MENFDLRKYLAENKLLKEEIDYPSIKDEMKKIYDIDVDLDTIEDFVTSYNDSEGMDIFDTTEREDFYLYLKDFDQGSYQEEEIDVNKILSDGGYDIIDDEELLMTVKSRLKGKSNIDAEKLNLLVMKIEDEEGGNIDFT